MAANPIDHVLDTKHWELFESGNIGFTIPFGMTKYQVLMIVASGILLAIFIPLARRIQSGELPRGPFWNLFESILTFVRNEIAKPCLGEHDADRFVPFLWTMFLFVMVCNLLGMIPFLGSPTGSFMVTLGLALCSFVVIHGAPILRVGPVHYIQSYAPHIDAPFGLSYVLVPLIMVLEIFGQFIKAFVLAIRLFANMFAGHTVLTVFLMFIFMARDAAWYILAPVTVASVAAAISLSILELFVALLQAFIFTFLTALFLGSTLHPEH